MDKSIDATTKSWFQKNSDRMKIAISSLVLGGAAGLVSFGTMSAVSGEGQSKETDGAAVQTVLQNEIKSLSSDLAKELKSKGHNQKEARDYFEEYWSNEENRERFKRRVEARWAAQQAESRDMTNNKTEDYGIKATVTVNPDGSKTWSESGHFKIPGYLSDIER